MYRKAIYELIGSFLVVLILGFVTSFSERDYLVIGLTTFFIYSVIISSLKNTNKALLNPILTLNFIVLKHQGIGIGILYFTFQLLGSVLGAIVLNHLNQRKYTHNTYPVITEQKLLCFFVECLGEFLLSMTYIIHFEDPNSIQENFGIQIGGLYTIFTLTFVVIQGGILNFGELFGPSVIELNFDDWFIHLGSHVLGCLLCNIFYYLFMQKNKQNVFTQKYTLYKKQLKEKNN